MQSRVSSNLMRQLRHSSLTNGVSGEREIYRVASFAKYPQNARKSAILLAEAGFAYIGSGADSDDKVICCFCGSVKQNWQEAEDIYAVHRALSPQCTMVLGLREGNIPLTSRPRAPEPLRDFNMKDWVIAVGESKCPYFAQFSARLVSFANWPADHEVKKEDLAKAGFFYDGRTTICFYCGGGLRSWEAGEDLPVTHAFWFPKCGFIQLQQGPVFIQTVQEYRRKGYKSPQMVARKMREDPSVFQFNSNGNALKNIVAVKTMVAMGYQEAQVLQAAESLTNGGISGHTLSAEMLLSALQDPEAPQPHHNIDVSASTRTARSTQPSDLDRLEEENTVLRQLTLCKFCKVNECDVVILPCGHFVSCTECIVENRICPVCNRAVQQYIRAFLSDLT